MQNQMDKNMEHDMEAGVQSWFRGCLMEDRPLILPPPSNSWTINIIWLYVALNRTPNIGSYWVGEVPKIEPRGLKHSKKKKNSNQAVTVDICPQSPKRYSS